MAKVSPEVPETSNNENAGSKCNHCKLVIFLSVSTVVFAVLFIVFTVLYNLEVKKKSNGNAPEVIVDGKCDLSKCTRNFKSPPLIVMSTDGFRASYLRKNITPAIERLIDCGTHSKFMLPSFPSKTFPNHYAIATGLYPAWNGIVDNHFYDADLPGRNFSPSVHDQGWYLGEPIWNTVQKHNMKSAVYFWPGSESPVNGTKPTIAMPYDSNVSFTQRIDKVIEWLNLADDQRPSLIQVYIEQPDAAGHVGGPDSEVVKRAMITADAVVGYLTNRLLHEGLMGCVNLILVSDHGMQYINSSRAVVMDEILPQPFNQALFTGAVGHITMLNNDTTVDRIVAPMHCHHGENYLTFKTHITPARFHYSGSKRIGQVVMIARPGALIYRTRKEAESGAHWHGNHGYDNRLVSMRAIFVAIGPDIAEKKEIPEFQNVQLYNLFADLLKVPPALNNGTKGHLYSVLRNPPSKVPELNSRLTSSQCTSPLKIANCNEYCQDLQNMYSNCKLSQPTIPLFITDGHECIISLCDAVIYYNKKLRITQLVETMITKETWTKPTQNPCVSYVEGISESKDCNENLGQNVTNLSLFINKAQYNTISDAFAKVRSQFANGTWGYLVDAIAGYVQKYGKIMMFSGPVYDSNYDGHRDSDEMILSSSPTHIFVILFRCASPHQQISPELCHNVTFIPFVLPIVDEDFNCLSHRDYLYENTARILDIELLTGLQFFTNRELWSPEEAILLRTRVTRGMW